MVVDGLNGLVIPPNDVDALTRAIQFLYDRPDLVRLHGAAGRERVVKHFTWEHSVSGCSALTAWPGQGRLGRGDGAPVHGRSRLKKPAVLPFSFNQLFGHSPSVDQYKERLRSGT